MRAMASTAASVEEAASCTSVRCQAGRASVRILHVVTRLAMGGMEHAMLKVIGGLDQEPFEHRICALRGFDEEMVRRENLEGKMFVPGTPGSGAQFFLPRLAKLMRAYRPHIVHARNWGTIEAIPAARLARVPVAIYSEHGYDMEMLGQIPLRRRIARRAAYKMANAVFAVTEELRNYHAKLAWVAPDSLQVLRNGVNTERFAPRKELRGTMRERWGLPLESLVIGSVGRLAPIKDHATLLAAAETLMRDGRDVRVVLAGAGPEMSRLQERVRQSAKLAERVNFLGAVEKVEEVLAAADIFVLPSLSEGMSNTLLEAMACGLPVAATRVGGNPELIEDEVSGLLFAPGDVGQLTDILRALANNPELRQRLGEAARRQAVEKFSLDRMMSEYRNLYLEQAGRRGVLGVART